MGKGLGGYCRGLFKYTIQAYVRRETEDDREQTLDSKIIWKYSI